MAEEGPKNTSKTRPWPSSLRWIQLVTLHRSLWKVLECLQNDSMLGWLGISCAQIYEVDLCGKCRTQKCFYHPRIGCRSIGSCRRHEGGCWGWLLGISWHATRRLYGPLQHSLELTQIHYTCSVRLDRFVLNPQTFPFPAWGEGLDSRCHPRVHLSGYLCSYVATKLQRSAVQGYDWNQWHL